MMHWEQIAVVAFQILTGGLALSLAGVAWQRRRRAGRPAIYLALAALAVTIYAWGYAGELTSSTLPELLFWIRIQYLGIPYILPLWVLFAVSISGHQRWVTRGRVAALLIIPVTGQVAALTLSWHPLFYINPHLVANGPFLSVGYTPGPIYVVHLIFLNVCLIFVTGLLMHMLIRAAPAFRRQALFFVLAMVSGWAGLGVYVAGLAPYNLDLSTLSMSVAGLLMAIGLFRYGGLQLVPVARDVIFERMSDGVLVLDAQGRLLDFNPALQALLPELRQAAIGLGAAEVLAAYPALVAQMAANLPGPVDLEVAVSRPAPGETSVRYCQSRISPVSDGPRGISGQIVTLHDYSEVRHLLEQLRHLATRDELTGVFNRRHFTELAEREVARLHRHANPIALISLDLDHFKDVNDTYGHAAGDAVLRAAAELCQWNVRKTDVLGRMGGEEFLVLLPQTTLAAAQVKAERLRQALETLAVVYEGQTLLVTGSFGVAGLDQPGLVTLETLLRRADQALYQAKEAGRNQVVAAPASHEGPLDPAGVP